jgi:hypothetical protein
MNLAYAIASAVDRIRRDIDPLYPNQFSEEKEDCRVLQLVAVAGIVGSVALAILGFFLSVPSGIAAIIGIPLLFASLPIGYVSYNLYTISKNMLEIFNNHSYYRALGLGYFDRQRVVSRLETGTFFADWAVDMIADGFCRGRA